MINKSFWKNKKVLITGFSGFKGFWLYQILKRLGSEVFGISLEGNNSEIYELASKLGSIKNDIKLDICNNELLDNLVNSISPDIVFHFAAQPLVFTAKNEPIKTINTNVIGTFNILESLRKSEKRVGIIVATTDKVYKNPDNNNTEESELGAFEIYGATKVCQELIIDSFNMDPFFINKISVVRSGNVLGGGDGAKDRLLTDILYSIATNNDIVLRHPNSIRPWQFIFDSLSGYVLTAELNYLTNRADKFNLHSPNLENLTVLEIANHLKSKFLSTSDIVVKENMNLESNILRLNSNKANKILNWEPKFNLEETVQMIYEWEISKKNNDILNIIEEHLNTFFIKQNLKSQE